MHRIKMKSQKFEVKKFLEEFKFEGQKNQYRNMLCSSIITDEIGQYQLVLTIQFAYYKIKHFAYGWFNNLTKQNEEII